MTLRGRSDSKGGMKRNGLFFVIFFGINIASVATKHPSSFYHACPFALKVPSDTNPVPELLNRKEAVNFFDKNQIRIFRKEGESNTTIVFLTFYLSGLMDRGTSVYQSVLGNRLFKEAPATFVEQNKVSTSFWERIRWPVQASAIAGGVIGSTGRFWSRAFRKCSNAVFATKSTFFGAACSRGNVGRDCCRR